MNALALVTHGYLCVCGTPLVASVAPSVRGSRNVPTTTAGRVTPKTSAQVGPDMKPVTKPKRRR